MRDDWNISFHPSIELQAFKYSVNKIIVRGNNEYQIYTEADLSLKNLFYEFGFIINQQKLHICIVSIAVMNFGAQKTQNVVIVYNV